MISSEVRRDASTAEIVAELRTRRAFVMVSHVNPDGDTLGSGLALGLALRAIGKRVYYFQQDPVPRNLRFLPDADRVSRELPPDLPSDTLWVFCDMSSPSRAGEFLPSLQSQNVLNIDHHLGNQRFGAYNYVLESECSTGSCVLRLLRGLGAAITPEIATCLLTTIMTDTGGFMHSNTTADVLRASAELVELGADKARVTKEVFANKRFAAIKLLGAALDSARLEECGRYCWSVVDDAMLASCDADAEDTEEIVQHLRSVEGVEVAALFKAYRGEVRVSLRSSGTINVQVAAARLGGGGHALASGLTYRGSLEDGIRDVRRVLREEGL
ncbi:MAG: bifunctional oligoribonuclease/PAP phosphatase NrnA [Candidatus Eremiobacteraeota bacterium]|nr:bifunctional oligoribonuclease/PAP phosphatase NrnA [Candidatus Eremiobacteraeota bacterium]MBV9647832.1 bifunctional oligoribonuclease/PAP phosphatase NrnA [Candidatus Eremiobacteraeota bacterium]